ncbi:uncharacterized protein LOC142310334 isoform X1 [Anomaloglossus baeobatrachus]|uniref:uncharacterized protein LOC142310334 isoform X1 n=1 Tax=Anomaloglossus baeobatrachus TaxID=238106 RepID=UPI003F4FF93B
MADRELLAVLAARLQSGDPRFREHLLNIIGGEEQETVQQGSAVITTPPPPSAEFYSRAAPGTGSPVQGAGERRYRRRDRSRSRSRATARDRTPASNCRRCSSHRSRSSRGSSRSRRSRSSRWRSPSSSSASSAGSVRKGRHRSSMSASGPFREASQASAVPLSLHGPTPVPASRDGEFNYAGAWGTGDSEDSLASAVKALLARLAPSDPPPPAPLVSQSESLTRASVHKEAFFCGISPLGSHLEDDTKAKIWTNQYIDIWSLVSVDQHTIDRERRPNTDRWIDRKPKVARTMGNWLQAFSVLGHVMGQKHPERCSELFAYMDLIYNAYKSHGGTAWHRYDEEFRRRLALQPEIGWGVKATDVWLRLMMSQRPFQPAAAPPQHPTVKGERPCVDRGHAGCLTRATAVSLACVNTGTSVPLVAGSMPRQSVQNLADKSARQVQLKEKTPVKVEEMGPWLDQYPNKSAAACLRVGFTYGFFIPFVFSSCPMFSRNLKSAVQYPQVVADKIAKEVALGRLMGPFSSPPFSNLRVSPIGVVPKKEPNTYRLIHHLSFPRGSSVNDGIAKDEVSVSYVSFDRAVALLREAGEGAYMAKSDVESAFRLLPVHPDCYHLLGCHFGDAFYYDTCLPMGCSISCFYFELFSTFLEWAARYEAGSRAIIHYLDDFLFVAQDSSRCSYLLNSFCSLMQRLGVPLSSEKTVGPARCLTFLGIELDSVQMVFRLPPDKISKLLGLVKGFLAVSKVTLKQMQSLLGMLVFACRVMPMGRVFSRPIELWGFELSNKRVCFWSDNMPVVQMLNSLSSSSLPVLSLLRHLVLRCLQHNVFFRSRHIPGVQNQCADALSRFKWQEFHSLMPEACSVGKPCPQLVWDLVTKE